MKPSSIKLNPNNPRLIKDVKFAKLVKSLKEFPDMAKVRPVVIDEDNVVLGGNMRLKAMIEAGWEDIPVKKVEGWTEEQKREFIVKDNLGYGEWDYDILANDYDLTELGDWGMDIPEDLLPDLDVEEDEAPQVDSLDVKSQPGEVYLLGKHRLMCGDSTKIEDVEKLMDGNKADMVFTDPPYGVDYDGINNDSEDGLEDLLNESFSLMNTFMKPGASIYVFHADRTAHIFHNCFRKLFHFSSMIIWKKQSLTLSQTDYQSIHEPCLYGWKEGSSHFWNSDRKQTSVWEHDRKSEEGHTTPKPTSLVSNAIKNSSNREDLVMDLFGGSGSTLIACEQTDRTCYMMELDPKYCDVIRKRYHKFTTGSEEGWDGR